MQVMEIAEGLWRWTTPHPDWTPDKGGPGGWERDVGSIFYEPATPHEPIILIDPLVPAADSSEATRFWKALDRDLARSQRGIAIVIGNRYHGRSADVLRRRYAERGVTVYVPHGAEGHVSCVPTHGYGAGMRFAESVVAHAVEGLTDPEMALFIEPYRALVFSDALIGVDAGHVRIAPRTWSGEGDDEAARRAYDSTFRSSLLDLAVLAPESLLPSHGSVILQDGAAALAEALAAPAWGEG